MDEKIIRAMETPAEEVFKPANELKMEYGKVKHENSALGKLQESLRKFSEDEMKLITEFRKVPDSQKAIAISQSISLFRDLALRHTNEPSK